jgi:hypothetical protein
MQYRVAGQDEGHPLYGPAVRQEEGGAAFAAHKGEVTEGYLANPSAAD